MKSILLTIFVASMAFAEDSSLDMKAGIIQKGAGIPTFTNKYEFPVRKFKDHLCQSNDGGVHCEWKKLGGEGRYSIVRTNVDEITGKKTVMNFVFEKTGDVLFLTRMVHNDVDVDRRSFAEASRTMSILNLQFKEASKSNKNKKKPVSESVEVQKPVEPETPKEESPQQSSSW